MRGWDSDLNLLVTNATIVNILACERAPVDHSELAEIEENLSSFVLYQNLVAANLVGSTEESEPDQSTFSISASYVSPTLSGHLGSKV